MATTVHHRNNNDVEKGSIQEANNISTSTPANVYTAGRVSGAGIANPGTLCVYMLLCSLAREELTKRVVSGLFSFASTTFILSLYNVNARGINVPNVVVGMAVGCGGLVQLLAGMWEFPRGNTFAATGKPRSSCVTSMRPLVCEVPGQATRRRGMLRFWEQFYVSFALIDIVCPTSRSH